MSDLLMKSLNISWVIFNWGFAGFTIAFVLLFLYAEAKCKNDKLFRLISFLGMGAYAILLYFWIQLGIMIFKHASTIPCLAEVLRWGNC